MQYFIPVLFFVLAACAPVTSIRGNVPNDALLAQVAVGEQTKEDVQRMLGSPSSSTMFEEETWLYISSVQTQSAFLEPEENKREIVAITFDADGKVKAVNKLAKNDGLDIDISDEETPTSGHSFGLMEQLFGNVGRFEKSK